MKPFTTPTKNIFDTDPKEVEGRMKLIREEMKELEAAVKDKDYVETADALADILYVVYGMGTAIGMNLDTIFDLVHKSNMSKLCTTEQEAKDTVEWYKNNNTEYDSPTYRQTDKYFIVYNKSTGKILKSINYKPVDLTYLNK
jgi:phosphoribosyl-ATP pyrophosphohydrolase